MRPSTDLLLLGGDGVVCRFECAGDRRALRAGEHLRRIPVDGRLARAASWAFSLSASFNGADAAETGRRSWAFANRVKLAKATIKKPMVKSLATSAPRELPLPDTASCRLLADDPVSDLQIDQMTSCEH